MRVKDGYYYPLLFQSRETLAVSPIQDLADDIYTTRVQSLQVAYGICLRHHMLPSYTL